MFPKYIRKTGLIVSLTVLICHGVPKTNLGLL